MQIATFKKTTKHFLDSFWYVNQQKDFSEKVDHYGLDNLEVTRMCIGSLND